MLEYDIAILGRGAAAFSAAIKASELTHGEARIAMVGTGPLGGTCVNVGCVPSKYLLEASHKYFYSKDSKFQGVSSSSASLDFSGVMQGLNRLVRSFRKSKYEDVLKSYKNVDSFEGNARFVSANEIEFKEDKVKTIKAKNFIIATGSRPSAPPVEGLEKAGYITSDTVWKLESRPESLAVIGGGAIGLELGQALLHLGSEVILFEALPRIAASSEPEVSELLHKRLVREGMKIFTETRIASVSKVQAKKRIEIVTSRGKSSVDVDEILVATGRTPNTDRLSLEKAWVKTDQRGFIIVDKQMRTSNPRIYAAGDCISKKLMLETLAAREGVIAAMNIICHKESIDYLSAPWAIFTYPQVASVGYTEEEFMKLTGSCSCRIVSFDKVPKAEMIGEEGVVKLVIDPSNGKVAGIHIFAPYASEYIIEGALALKYGLTYEDIINTTHIFPTLSESIKISAQAFVRNVERMSCCVE